MDDESRAGANFNQGGSASIRERCKLGVDLAVINNVELILAELNATNIARSANIADSRNYRGYSERAVVSV